MSSDYTSETYGDQVADLYDNLYTSDFVPPPEQIGLLAELAHGGPVVEIGSGTGRITVPLAATGLAVIAVDASQEMTDRLAKKTGSLPVIPVTADAADYVSEEPVTMVFACFNTFFLLADEQTQRASSAMRLVPSQKLFLMFA